MKEAQVRRIPIVNDRNEAVGLVSFGDLLAILSKEFIALTETTTPFKELPKVA
jgi:CBS domain-containing protein